MISYCDQLWEGGGGGLKREGLIGTLDVQIRYNVSSLFATGCSFRTCIEGELNRVMLVEGFEVR